MLLIILLLFHMCNAQYEYGWKNHLNGRFTILGDGGDQKHFLCNNERTSESGRHGENLEKCWIYCRFDLDGRCEYFAFDKVLNQCIFWDIPECDEGGVKDDRYEVGKIDKNSKHHYWWVHQTNGDKDNCGGIGSYAHKSASREANDVHHCAALAKFKNSEYFSFRDIEGQGKFCYFLYGTRCNLDKILEKNNYPLYRNYDDGNRYTFVSESTPVPTTNPTMSPTIYVDYGKSFAVSDDGKHLFISDPLYQANAGRIFVHNAVNWDIVGKSIVTSATNSYCGYDVRSLGSKLFVYCTLSNSASSQGEIQIFDTTNVASMKFIASVPAGVDFHVGKMFIATCLDRKVFMYTHLGVLIKVISRPTNGCSSVKFSSNDNFLMYHNYGIQNMIMYHDGTPKGYLIGYHRVFSVNNTKTFLISDNAQLQTEVFTGNDAFEVSGYLCKDEAKYRLSYNVESYTYDICVNACALSLKECVGVTGTLQISQSGNAFSTRVICSFFKECNLQPNNDLYKRTYLSLPFSVKGIHNRKTCLNGQMNINPIVVSNMEECFNKCSQEQYCDYYRVTRLGESRLCNMYTSQCTPVDNLDSQEVILYSVKTTTNKRPVYSDTMVSLSDLLNGEKLTSPNGRHVLLVQSDQNVVLYSHNRDNDTPLWSTGTDRKCGSDASFALWNNANIVVQCSDGSIVWESQSNQQNNLIYPFTLSMTNVGNLILKNARGDKMWETNTAPWELHNDQSLLADEYIRSNNKRYTLLMQGDQNIVVYDNGSPRWASNTSGRCPSSAYLLFQQAGNLVLYCTSGGAVWSTPEIPAVDRPGYLHMGDDGIFRVYNVHGGVHWQNQN